MARSASLVSDSDGKNGDASETVRDKVTDEDHQNGVEDSGDEGEDEEEYEIEEILDHEDAMFDDGRIGYLCKWKGYDSQHNSWVDEQDAGNATELIKTYWAKVKSKEVAKKKPRKSTDKSSASTTRKRAASPDPPKKRGRKSSTKEEDLEEDEVKTSKKQKTKKGARKTESTEPEDVVMEDPEHIAGDAFMKKFNDRKSWEDIVGSIDTVEKPAVDGPLIVYFRLNEKNGGVRVRLDSSVCRAKFPQALLSFYESNLKWKETEVDDDAPMS